MPDTSLFMPDTISAALQENLAAGLRALADALDAGELDGRFFNAIRVRVDDLTTVCICG